MFQLDIVDPFFYSFQKQKITSKVYKIQKIKGKFTVYPNQIIVETNQIQRNYGISIVNVMGSFFYASFEKILFDVIY